MSLEDPRPFSPDLRPEAVANAVRDYVQESRDRWLFRRILLFAVVGVFCFGILLAAVNNSSIGEALVWGVVALVSIYIGAPIADDWLQTRPGLRAA